MRLRLRRSLRCPRYADMAFCISLSVLRGRRCWPPGTAEPRPQSPPCRATGKSSGGQGSPQAQKPFVPWTDFSIFNNISRIRIDFSITYYPNPRSGELSACSPQPTPEAPQDLRLELDVLQELLLTVLCSSQTFVDCPLQVAIILSIWSRLRVVRFLCLFIDIILRPDW